MTLTEYLNGMRAARGAVELEAAIQAPFRHSYKGPAWSRIKKVGKECGRAICDRHPDGIFVPRYEHNLISVCGESYKVGYGQNSTGVRYVWHYAEQFTRGVLVRHGMSQRAAYYVWGCWSDYPHRCLEIIQEWRDGKLPDPVFNKLVLIRLSSEPVRVDRSCELKHRAHRPCGCGGTRWDWGCGWSGYSNFIHWFCDGCRRVYEEHVTSERLSEIRSQLHAARTAA